MNIFIRRKRNAVCSGILAIAVSICAGCTATTRSAEPSAVPLSKMHVPENAADVAQTILQSQTDGEDYTLLDTDSLELQLTTLYGLPEEDWSDAAVYAVGGTDAREIAVIRCVETEDVEDTAAALEQYRQDRAGDFFGYLPEQADLADSGAVLTSQKWVALLICEDVATASSAFTSSAESAASATIFTITETEQNEPVKFDPPNEHDMTLYDTSAIRAAWADGNPDGLQEKDAALYAKCQEIFQALITDDMNDLQKEAALYGWLIQNSAYDESALEPETRNGQPGSLDPSGPILEGRGICLGYSTAFQLLMDLAGVECITVVGAARGSTEDHAWNMVRLDGEWYCVDSTWDDPIQTDSSSSGITKNYYWFNITSEQMRESDHQWDETAVPEATASRFYWNGIDPLPEMGSEF